MIKDFKGIKPKIHKTCYLSESTDIIGEVILKEDVNIWFGVRIRGDVAKIEIGKNSNIQENSVLHGHSNGHEVIIGENVTVGHGAIIHGCEINSNVLVGMGAIILNGAIINKNTIIGAGSLITQGKVFEEGVLILGNPAKAVRKLTDEEIESIQKSADKYCELSKNYI